MKHIMLDLEALDSNSTGVLVSIGAVAFDLRKGELGAEFYCEASIANMQNQVEQYGRTINLRTIAWWMQQSDEARQVFKGGDDTLHSLGAMLGQFANFYHEQDKNCRLWGNGSDFDNVFLKRCYDSVGMPLPWSFRHNRCYRTMKNMRPGLKMKRVGTHHNGLDDAKTQALHLMELYRELRV